jgi:hypothetical protein
MEFGMSVHLNNTFVARKLKLLKILGNGKLLPFFFENKNYGVSNLLSL